MGFKIIHSAPAALDFDDIIFYITHQLKNPTAASALRDEYHEKLAILRESPRLYGLVPNEELARAGYHRFFFGNYVAFYHINDEEKKVHIVRIFYQRRDYGNLL